MADPPPVGGSSNEWTSNTSAVARYGFAALVSLASLAASLALLELDETPFYALLVAAVAVAVWFGGFGPGLLAAALCWGVGLLVFLGETDAADGGNRDERMRWASSLVVALAVVWVAALLRSGRERAASAVVAAQETIRDTAALQELAVACSVALTQEDVVRALAERMPGLLGARGGAIGLLDGDEIVVIGPGTPSAGTHAPGTRISLTVRAPIARAAANDRPIVVRDRETFERSFPDGIARTPYARAAVAVPLRIAGEVAGSMSYLFDDEEAITEDAEALAGIAAGLGGQALERARLYDVEAQSRRALDRILRMSPAFLGGSRETVTDAICREGRLAFGADVAALWRFRREGLELVQADPPGEPLVPGLRARFEDFPQLRDAAGNLQVSFVADVQAEARGEGLERVKRLGIHSSMRMPVVIAGETEHLVIVSWRTVVSEPDPSTIVLARRVADQAGLALEQLERRRAEEEAMAYADETRRLQEVTAALSLASSAADVGDACLKHALAAIGADAGYVVLARAGSVVVDMVSNTGYEEPELAVWRGFDLDADVPVSRAFQTGEPVWALTPDEVATFTALEKHTDACWIALPLRTRAGVRGILHLSFRKSRGLSEGERQWLQTVVSQCAQALERSLLFDEEQRLREQSERLQEITAELSNALTRVDVADVVLAGVEGAVGADAGAVAIVQEERQLLRTIASRGFGEHLVERLLETPLEARVPGAHAVRRLVPDFFGSPDELREAFPDLVAEDVGGSSFFFVPLVAGRRAKGLLTVAWEEPRTLTADERRFVLSVASQAAVALDRASTFESEQTIAATLQRSVLPATLPRVAGVQLAARYLPGTADLNVGGDWFDAIPLRDGRLGLVVGDVVGKGVQAAATMAQLRNGLRAFSLERTKPSTTIERLSHLAEEVLETAFATIVYAVIDPRGLVCRYTSAGHPPPLVVHADGRAELLEGGRGLPLGTGHVSRYPQDVVELAPGSVLVLYTDGLVERRGSSIDAGLEQLRTSALDGPREPEALLEHILGSLVGGGERDDDIALLAARVFSVAPAPLELRLPSDSSSLDLVRDAMRVWLEGVSLARNEAEDVVLATWEACANAIEHADRPGENENVVAVKATLDESRLRIVVEDSGRWKPAAQTPDRGLGLRLIHSLMSAVDVTADEAGTRVTFEKVVTGDSRRDAS